MKQEIIKKHEDGGGINAYMWQYGYSQSIIETTMKLKKQFLKNMKINYESNMVQKRKEK